MLAIVLPEPSTSISLATGVVCLAAQRVGVHGERLQGRDLAVVGDGAGDGAPRERGRAAGDASSPRPGCARTSIRRNDPTCHPPAGRVDGCGSDVFERERFREARIPERHQCATTRHPAERRPGTCRRRAQNAARSSEPEVHAVGMQHGHHAASRGRGSASASCQSEPPPEQPGADASPPAASGRRREPRSGRRREPCPTTATTPPAAFDVVDRLLRDVRVPDEEELREGNVGPEDGEAEEELADVVQVLDGDDAPEQRPARAKLRSRSDQERRRSRPPTPAKK